MARRRRFSVISVGTIGALAIAIGAWAFWTTVGHGVSSAAAGTLSAPTNVTVPSNVAGSTVHVSWTAPTPPASGTVRYYVQRYLGAVSSPACGTSPSSLITSTSCDDNGVVTGTYTYKVTAVWRTWTSQSGASGSVSVQNDATPPTSAITFPTAGGSYNAAGWTAGCAPGTDEICGTADDPGAGASGVNKVQVSIQRSSDNKYWNGSSWVVPVTWNDAAGTTGWSYTLAGSNLSDGVSFTVRSQAIDNAGNTQTTPDSKSFTFDVTNPVTASVTTPSGGSQFRAATVPASFSGSVADNSGGVGLNANAATFTLRRSSDGNYWTGAMWQVGVANLATTHVSTSGNTAATWTSAASMPTWTFEADGTFTVQATVTDKAGNGFTGSAVTFTLDKTNPIAASVTSPANGSNTNSFPATFSGSAADNSAGVGLNANSTTYTLQRSTDGNYWTGSAWQASAANLATSHSATTSNTAAAWTSTATMPSGGDLVDATYTIQATANDQVGNTFSGTAISFTLDRVNPTTASVTTPVTGGQFRTSTVPASFGGSVADNPGGVGLNANRATFTLRRSSDNMYWDGSSAWQVAAANLATTHPATSGNTAATWASNVTMPTWALEGDGTYTVQATVTDKAGNTFTGTAIAFTLDKTSPVTASVTSPAGGSFTNTFPVTFSGSAADNTGGVGLNANSTSYTLQRSTDGNYWTGSAWQASAANLATSHSATTDNTGAAWTSTSTMPSSGNLVDATYTIQATATDKVGNTFSGTAISFTLDRVNPITASVTSPADASSTNSFPATFSGSASDNSGGVGLNANSTTYTLRRSSDNDYWTGATWQVAVANLTTTHVVTSGNTAATWTSNTTMPAGANLVDATYTVQAKATDKAANTFTGTAITFTLDKTNPITASVTSPASGSFTIGFPSTFSGSAADNSGGVGLNANSTTYTLKRSSDNNYWTGSTWQTAVANLATTHSATTSNAAATWTSGASMPSGGNLVDATYTVQATATDKVGNAFTGTAITFLRDTVNPTGSITAPAGGSTIGGTATVTSSDAADAGSGVATVQFQERLGTSGAFTNIGSAVANPGPYTTSWDTTAVANGSYQIQAIITDRAGNSFTTPTVTVTVSNASTFTVSASTPQTAGTAFNVTITAKVGASTNTSYSGAHVIVFTGPGNAPNGQAPTYPASVNFVSGVGTASVTLSKAETTSITATENTITGTSGSIVVNAGTTAGIALSNITTSPTPAITCSGSAGSLACSSTGESNSAASTVAKVTLVDQFLNPVTNTTGSPLTIDLSATGNGTVSPSGSSALSIANGASTTGTSFTLSRDSGNSKSVVMTATLHGTTQKLTLTMSS